MEKKRLEELELISKNAFEYMKNVEKEYLDSKNVVERTDFISEFEENHSWDEVNYLFNEMNASKESRILFTNGFFGITLPIYAMIFAFIGIMSSALFGFTNSLTMKLVDIELKREAKDVNSALDLFIQTHSKVLIVVSGALLFVFIVLLIMYWIRHTGDSKRIQYLSCLKTVKDLKKYNTP